MLQLVSFLKIKSSPTQRVSILYRLQLTRRSRLNGDNCFRHGYQMIENARRVIAIECVIALQAVEYKGVDKLSPKHVRNMKNIVKLCLLLHKIANFIKISKQLHNILEMMRTITHNFKLIIIILQLLEKFKRLCYIKNNLIKHCS